MSVSASEVDEDSGRRLARVTATEAAVADATTRRTHPLLDHTHTRPFNGPLSGTTRVSRYQKGKTNPDFTEARDSQWQWHQLGRMGFTTTGRECQLCRVAGNNL